MFFLIAMSRYGRPSTVLTIKGIHVCPVQTEVGYVVALSYNQCIPYEAVVPKSSGSLFTVVIVVPWLAGWLAEWLLLSLNSHYFKHMLLILP